MTRHYLVLGLMAGVALAFGAIVAQGTAAHAATRADAGRPIAMDGSGGIGASGNGDCTKMPCTARGADAGSATGTSTSMAAESTDRPPSMDGGSGVTASGGRDCTKMPCPAAAW